MKPVDFCLRNVIWYASAIKKALAKLALKGGKSILFLLEKLVNILYKFG